MKKKNKIRVSNHTCNVFQATAKYHEMLNSVKEFMMINEVPRNLCERVLDYVVSKWANTKGVDQEKVLKVSWVDFSYLIPSSYKD